jgi:hypothetical protein
MRLLLRGDLFVEAVELALNAIEQMPGSFALLGIQLCAGRASQAAMSAVRQGGHHLQIA